MLLILQHPKVAWRDCVHCQRYNYDEETGQPLERDGKLLERNVASPPPCRTRRGCPKGTPENPRILSEQNFQAWCFDKECKAVNEWPDDPIVRRNAATIRAIEDGMKESRENSLHRMLMILARRR